MHPSPLVDVARLGADRPEAEVLASLRHRLDARVREQAVVAGAALVAGARARAAERPYLDAFLQEFGLSNPEGVALMCLAESLLRVPDADTADRLIAEKLQGGDWSAHSGKSDSLFVNASTWGLMLTGRVVRLPEEIAGNARSWFGSLTRRSGEPMIRQALKRAMRIIGEEFVVGADIESALARSARDSALALCSFDMLGEGARTDADALRYFEAYRGAIAAIGAATAAGRAANADPYAHSSLSIKLSALDPRYALLQRERVHARLVPLALELVRQAAEAGIAVTIDAEEQDRLEISLQVIEALARDVRTRDWTGLGFAVQAYGRRAPAVIDWARDLARATRRRFGVRLVKGAYWDSEIKRAQERGLADYPVFTRKVSTDVSFLGCAARLFDAADDIYPAFATHNAHTIGAVLALRPAAVPCEFQRLHGMGVLLYDEARRQIPDLPPVRVYAPVGPHANLLAYLVRRLLENGANTSFVNRFMDERVPVTQVVRDPLAELDDLEAIAHPGIPAPVDLYGASRRNSRGVDFGRQAELDAQRRMLAGVAPAGARPGGATTSGAPSDTLEIRNPARRDERVGVAPLASAADVAQAFASAARAQRAWNAAGAEARAACLTRAADLLESRAADYLPLLVREAGKVLPDAVGEFREAVDYLRYYAAEARRVLGGPVTLTGPTGELNQLAFEGRGVLACVSPWNFPLAIFTGQVVAALAAGNSVIAKPAEATPLIALKLVALLHECGVPREVLHCLPMHGREFGETALADPHLAGVVFTGSTATGQWLNRQLAARDGAILPLVAETGGLNAMVVDSTALPEQVIDDVVSSAFGSAGQRCSALRVLCVQDDAAEPIIEMLGGAMDALVVGDPAELATDIGPVISAAAASKLDAYIEYMAASERLLKRLPLGAEHARGSFVAPTLIEIGDWRALRGEQFGPVLHVLRYRRRDLDALLAQIRASQYALTLGVHSRLDSTWRQVHEATLHGNTYVNRNMIGAVVGVQPFGGSGLSGTGPKAGGPHYLTRLAHERTLTINTTATGGNVALLKLQ